MIVCRFVIKLYLETNISTVNILRNNRLATGLDTLEFRVDKKKFEI